MTDSQTTEPALLKPEDFAVFGGFSNHNGRPRENWILGPQIIRDFGMQVDNVDIVVSDKGWLSVTPKTQGSDCSFHCQSGLWARTADLEPIEK